MTAFKISPFRRRTLTALFLAAALSVQALAQAPAPSRLSQQERAIAENITIASIKESTTILSSAEMEGRGTMQPGGDRAASWIAGRYKDLGLKPLGDKGTYLQKIDFRELTTAPETSFTAGDITLKHGDDFAIAPFAASSRSVSGDMVFVGYAIVNPKAKINDLGDVNVRGKIVVMLEGPPAGFPKEDWEKANATMVFIQNLLMRGAAGIVFIGHGRETNPPDEMVDYFSRRQIQLADETPYGANIPPFLYVSNKGAEKLFAKANKGLKESLASAETTAFTPVDLNLNAKINLRFRTVKGTSSNVVGYIEGSDPKLKEEAIVFTAHYDAYGKENGKIYYGAADNALGTSEMLAVAEAYSKMPEKPKRSVIFLAVTGEEYGLYGSKHWAKKPTWDIKKVAANLNTDGIGSEVYGPVKTVVGYGSEHSTLGVFLNDVAAAYGVNVIPDPKPEDKVFYRSDHYSFVERGVPALMLLGAPEGEVSAWLKRIEEWEKSDYHQPGDVIRDDWAWEGAETIAEIMGIIGWRLAEAESMPSWLPSSRFAKLQRGNSKPLPEEN